jgi:hypothetical protein
VKLGKLPARKDAVKLKLSDYLTPTKLPTPPKSFGHDGLINSLGWGLLGNDTVGDCVIAGGAHETMLWNTVGGQAVSFTTQSVLSDYSAITGYNPNDPNSDQGTDTQQAAKYRQDVGLLDAQGKRHKIGAYLALTPGDYKQLLIAAWLFEAVGLGVNLPRSAMSQFDKGREWTVVKGSPDEGGHYIPLIGHHTNLVVVSWGRAIRMSRGFYQKYNDESLAYLSEEMLINGKSFEGFNLDQLRSDLAALKRA